MSHIELQVAVAAFCVTQPVDNLMHLRTVKGCVSVAMRTFRSPSWRGSNRLYQGMRVKARDLVALRSHRDCAPVRHCTLTFGGNAGKREHAIIWNSPIACARAPLRKSC